MIDYEFAAVNLSDFELCFTMVTSNKLLMKIFNKSRQRLIKKGVVTAKDADPNLLQKFEIDPRFYNLMHTVLKKQIKYVANEIKKDGIVILNSRVEYGQFIKNVKGDWDIKIKVGGQYAKK